MKKAFYSSPTLVEIDDLETQEGYHTFLRFALDYGDACCMSIYVNDGMTGIDDFRLTRWGFLAGSILDWEVTRESPVTFGPRVLLVYLRPDAVVRRFLWEKRHIYDFRDSIQRGGHYNWLWDPAFLKRGSIFFSSCTHEEFCGIDRHALALYQNARQP